jgi:hypothetical protein
VTAPVAVSSAIRTVLSTVRLDPLRGVGPFTLGGKDAPD